MRIGDADGGQQVTETRESDEDQQMSLRRSDWLHLRASLAKLNEARPNLTVWYAVCFAIAAAAGASIYPVAVAGNLPPWVAPLYVCVTLSCFIIGATLAWLERRFGREMRMRIRDIDVDIREIENPPDQASPFA
jgi:hypothetical protein